MERVFSKIPPRRGTVNSLSIEVNSRGSSSQNPLKTRVLLLLAALAALVPTAQAQNDSYTGTWSIGVDQFSFEKQSTFSGQQAADLRQTLDQGVGNGDGTLTRAEVEIWEERNTKTHSENEPNCFADFEMLRLDGQTPLRISETWMETSGLPGATTSQAAVDHAYFIAFQYRAPPSDRVKASMNLNSDETFLASAECYLGYSIGTPKEQAEPVESDGPAKVLFHPLGDAKILKESVRPAEALQAWDGKGFRFDSEDPAFDGNFSEFPTVITFTIQRGGASSGGTIQDVGLLLGVSAGGTVGLLGVAMLFTEVGRYNFLKFLFLLPGFTRVHKDAVLEHSKREELYNFIKANQGPCFSDLRRSLELSNGNLIHHLRILEMQGYVTGQRDGFRKRFYVRGPKVVPATYLTRTQQQLLEVIGAHPGLTQKELSGLVGLPRELVFYHTKQLALRGRLEIKQDGNRRRYWLSATPAPATSGMRPSAN